MKLFFRLILVFCTVFMHFEAKASHIIGGEIYYDYLGNNQYKIYIAVYRDCATANGAQYDNPLPLAIYTSTNNLYKTVNVPFPGSTVLPIAFSNPCIVAPSGFCNERAIYTTIVLLPPRPGGYTLSYQRCCRRPDVINIVNPGDTGLTLTCKIPGDQDNLYVNSSPRFTNYPPLVLCNNDVLNFNHAATDADGDQLVYELITPLSGATDLSPAPNPAPPPPYAPIVWRPNFSAGNPFGPGATISINPTTGLIQAAPLMLGMFVVGVRVSEYRNGVLIGKTDRDFIFKVINCNISLDAKITPQDQMSTFVSYCEGTTITFQNQSYGASAYLWDFGVPGTSTDQSTQATPTFTFPAPGTYTVTLIANPGWPCTDTSVQIFNVFEHLTVDFTHTDSLCLKNNAFDFQGTFAGPAGTQLSWNFGNNATPSTGNGNTINNVHFNQSGVIPVTLTGTFNQCVKTKTKNLYIYPQSLADFEFMPEHLCNGFEQNFINTSTLNVNNYWDFGVQNSTDDLSTIANPTFTYPIAGNYTVTLIVSNGNQCTDTLSKVIEIIEPITVSFVHNDSLCITNNSFNFDGTVSGPPQTIYTWNFGSQAQPDSSNLVDVSNVVYNAPGIFPVTLTGTYQNCSETAHSTVRIFAEPTINFSIDDGLKCAPYTADFTNLSIVDQGNAAYFWDFGDGTQSTDVHPSHVYENPGIYNITLKMITFEGCKDTLTLYLPDLVNVRPSPIAAFSIDTNHVDICHSAIQFTNLSIGGTTYRYVFDDLTTFSVNENPLHIYHSSGQKRPYLYVTNQYGCTDISYQELFVEPYTVYIPNAFTIDGNNLNETFKPIIYLDPSIWDFKIFNRWGELIFYTADPHQAWDGTYKGLKCPDGLYTYVLRYQSCEERVDEQIITGHVVLLK